MGNAWFVGGVFGCFEFHYLIASLGLFGCFGHSEPVGIGGETVCADFRIVEFKAKVNGSFLVLNFIGEKWFVEVDTIDVEQIGLNHTVSECAERPLCGLDAEEIVLWSGASGRF